MSEARDRLERLQARVKELEALVLPDQQLQSLADALDREVHAYRAWLEKRERKAERAESGGQAGRVLGFAFSLLFVTPIVAIIGVSLGRALRHETEAAVACLVVGVLLVLGTFVGPLRHLVAHGASADWRRLRAAQREVEAIRTALR